MIPIFHAASCFGFRQGLGSWKDLLANGHLADAARERKARWQKGNGERCVVAMESFDHKRSQKHVNLRLTASIVMGCSARQTGQERVQNLAMG